jgi:hypothetical protein
LFPANATSPGVAFITEWLSVAQFLYDHFVGTGTVDAFGLMLSRGIKWLANKTKNNDETEHDETDLEEDEVQRYYFLSQRNLHLLAEMIYVRLVDQYLVYLADVLALAFHVKPEMLRSGKQITYEVVLQYTNMEYSGPRILDSEAARNKIDYRR